MTELKLPPTVPFFRTINFKLIMLGVLVGLGLNGVALVGIRHIFEGNDKNQSFARPVLRYLAQSVADGLGSPPDLDRITRMSRQTGLDLRVENTSGLAIAGEGLPGYAELEPHLRTRRKYGFPSGYFAERFFVAYQANDHRYIFFLPEGIGFELNYEKVGLTLLSITITLALGIFFLRRIHRPITDLMVGVAAVKSGNFTSPVQVRSKDEYAVLATSFNDMRDHVSRMLEQQKQLLLDVSHELRSPMARMKLSFEMLSDDSRRTELQDDLRELETMVSDLLESARVENLSQDMTREPIDLKQCLQSVESEFCDRLPGLVIVLPKGPVYILGELRSLKIAFRNIIDNALRYSGSKADPVEVKVERTETVVHVLVRDHGPGVSPGELERIFQPFYRTDRSRTRETGGYGLGLNLTAKIVEGLGGDIRAELPPGGGLLITVELPVSSH